MKINKFKKVLFFSSLFLSPAIPLVSISCSFGQQEDYKQKKYQVQLLSSNQIQFIKNQFKFTLKNNIDYNNDKIDDIWNKYIKRSKKGSNEIDLILNWDSEFKRLFNFEYHKLNGFGSEHKYIFELTKEGMTPTIKYKIICVDRNNQLEGEGLVKLEID
ncbi:hypothetical protein [Metamycoplasma canadense]|uniref:Lipoprotein n=1 Tax=Metamycoplasma canadense TaxID=29554 RepID=A0A077L9T7_9BACT|nr:hypothetical protein [Metamycoplasma canadense]BAP39793.1 hypothetical protein MCAN360_0774 [Metamycoplasma canadense]